MSEPHTALLGRIRNRAARIGVIGLGYVGLPLARTFAERGFVTLGFDVNHERIAALRALPLAFEATSDLERLHEPDVAVICVPTPLTPTREPDLGHVIAAAHSVAARLRPGQVIVLTSTTYPGTTRDVVAPILSQRGLKAGHDFFLAYSPEREDPGNTVFTTATIPRVVGGHDAASLELAVALFEQTVVRVVPVSSLEVAEASKILENTYRAVNIALVNELKVLYDRMGIDIWEVIEAARSKPFGFQAFSPGPGLGGHCIPIDPFYLSWVARRHGMNTRLIEVAGEINTSMPEFVVTKVADALRSRGKSVAGSRILLLGMAYKKDVDDVRESPGLELFTLLTRQGAHVQYNDPHVPRTATATSQPLTTELLATQDCILIVTEHSAYDWSWIVAHAPLIIDTRNATQNVSVHRERIVMA